MSLSGGLVELIYIEVVDFIMTPASSCRENLFEEMLQEKEEIAAKRKRCKEILRVLQQAAWVCPFPSGLVSNLFSTVMSTSMRSQLLDWMHC